MESYVIFLESVIPLRLFFAVLQIRRERITLGYYDAGISNTTRMPHILCLPFRFELLQTVLIQTASTHPTLSFSNCVSFPVRFNMLPPLQMFVSMQSPSNPLSILFTFRLSLSALLDLIPAESNFTLTQNSRSMRQSPDFMAYMGDKAQRAE